MYITPCVSVIIPTYNCCGFITKTLDSIINQTFKDYEIIIVDDDSSDNTFEVLSDYLSKYSFIKYIKQKNSGVSVARNNGILASKGKYIAFLDSDDLWDKNKLGYIIDLFNEDDALKLIHTNIKYIDEDGVTIGTPEHRVALHGDIFKSIYFRRTNICTSSVVVERVALLDTNLFDVNLSYIGCEDRDLWLTISRMYRVGYINKPLTYYRVRKGSLSKNLSNMLKARMYVIDKHSIYFRLRFIAKRIAKSVVYKEVGDFMYFNDKNIFKCMPYYFKSILLYPMQIVSYYALMKVLISSIYRS